MSVVDSTSRFAKRRAHTHAVEAFNRHSEWLEKQTRQDKCCASLETGTHPEHDTHLCLRKKHHQGPHTDTHTGLTWKWDTEPK